ncbi:MAG: coproporphyrinogen dehydrogenase HemZ, partial [Hespellia sp.]|nr:coproporphyrinogen dehydrogenase HemZ [Hespellia sp.]
MIQLVCRDCAYAYDAYHIVKAFYPNVEIEQRIEKEQEPLISLEIKGGSCFCYSGERIFQIAGDISDDKHAVNRKLYRMLAKQTAEVLPWGVLTGVRPTKLVMARMEEGWDTEQIRNWMQETYLVSAAKACLGIEIAERERALLRKLDYQDGYSLYVGIPFCPSICAYCSFSSSPIAKWKGQVEAYLDALFRELAWIGEVSLQKHLNTIYIGGGTPTTLDAEQLERLLCHLEQHFSYDAVREFTVEAGRPDSITEEKLEVMKRHKVTRISINPQTMQQRTLERIGRRHTVEETKTAFSLARKLGFDNINMDLIAGLPGETSRDMEDTLNQIRCMKPDSLTIHSLAVKRAALYGQHPMIPTSAKEMTRMIEAGAQTAREMGLMPYYLYRQKNMAGNFENVGYAEVDKAGIYNILIMEEKQTIVACGAGSISKRVYPDGRIERSENVKDVAQYIERIGEMI